MKLIYFCLLAPLLLLTSCGETPSSNDRKPAIHQQVQEVQDVHKIQEANKKDTLSTYRKYDVKSGVITFNTSMNTITVDVTYKTVVSFDHYGMVERRDTYDGNVLSETFLSDGFNNYNISHKNKQIVRTGKAYRGTESKFGWDKISQEDIKAGKVVKDPPMIIAGKECMVYTILAGIATVTYGGWKHIILLNKVESPGGKSISIAEKVEIIPVDENLFKLPEGYSIKG